MSHLDRERLAHPPRARALHGTPARVAELLDRHLAGLSDVEVVRASLSRWGAVPPDLGAVLARVRADWAPWAEWADATCERDYPHSLCARCRQRLYAWHDVRDAHALAIMRTSLAPVT